VSDWGEWTDKARKAGNLGEVRTLIDSVDSELLQLLSQRARLAERVAELKEAAGDTSSFYRPEREAQVLAGIRERNPGPLADDTIAWLFREVMSACLALEKPLTIACLGPAGSFSEQAAQRAFGHGGQLVFEPGIREVFRAVASEAVDYGVVPVENSTEGSVSMTLDSLIAGDVTISGELMLRIDQQLMAREDAAERPERIVSHAQSLAQCRDWLDAHYPGVELMAVMSNSEAARMAAESPSVHAIGPALAAERYGLTVRSANIQDQASNTTRFVVIGRDEVPPSGQDKTSLLLSIRNEPGALASLLAPLAELGIDLSRIESRPARDKAWDYLFFIDIEGHREDPKVVDALERMRPHCVWLRVLGSYPRAFTADQPS